MGIKIIELKTHSGKEFILSGFEGWEEFDTILRLLEKDYGCLEIEKVIGPYSKYCKLEKGDLLFELRNHPEIGNSLCLIQQNDRKNVLLKKLLEDIIKSGEL